MALLDKYNNKESNLGIYRTPIMGGALRQSRLHNEYSINGRPPQKSKPLPSTLDLNGMVPKYNYKDNTPEGRSF